MRTTHSMVISMRLPLESGKRLKRMANRHGWTPSDASARLVEEGLRRSEFAFIDFRDSPAGRQAYIQGSTLAVWEVMLLVRSVTISLSGGLIAGPDNISLTMRCRVQRVEEISKSGSKTFGVAVALDE